MMVRSLPLTRCIASFDDVLLSYLFFFVAPLLPLASNLKWRFILQILLGFADDVLDLRWAVKILLSLWATLPLLMAYAVQHNL